MDPAREELKQVRHEASRYRARLGAAVSALEEAIWMLENVERFGPGLLDGLDTDRSVEQQAERQLQRVRDGLRSALPSGKELVEMVVAEFVGVHGWSVRKRSKVSVYLVHPKRPWSVRVSDHPSPIGPSSMQLWFGVGMSAEGADFWLNPRVSTQPMRRKVSRADKRASEPYGAWRA